MVIIAIDVGTVRVGCAQADSAAQIPFPVAVWQRAQSRAEKALVALITEQKPELLVVGLPLGPQGERTSMCDSVEAFVSRLAKRASIAVVYVDEAFSSEEALERLRAAGSSPSELDAFAACLILERYFELHDKSSNQS